LARKPNSVRLCSIFQCLIVHFSAASSVFILTSVYVRQCKDKNTSAFGS
jgi:hypothetical protein